MNNEANHYSSLDLLRGISGYGVAVSHYFAFLHGNQKFEYISFLFVEFFFILSGYVLFPQLIKVFNNKKNLIYFYVRRWLRTIPLYTLCLLMISLIFDKIFSLDFFKYLFFLQDIKPNFLDEAYYPIVWSLSIEEFFYIIFPIILILIRRDLAAKLIILLALIIITKFFIIDSIDLKFFRTGTFIRFDAILVGFLCRYFIEKIDKKFFLLIFSIILLFIFLSAENYFLGNKSISFVKMSLIFLMQILSILFVYLFISFEETILIKKIQKFSSLVSKQTYSVYLTHMIFIYVFLNFKMQSWIEFIFYIISLFATSTFLYYFIEDPILKRRPKLKYD